MVEWVCIAFYLGVASCWHLLCSLPLPTLAELFKSIVVFIALYPVRLIMKAVLPEDTVARRVYKSRRSTVPTPAEHQGVSAIVSELFRH